MLVVRHSLRAAVAVRFATRSIANTQILRDADLAVPLRTPTPKHDEHNLERRGGPRNARIDDPDRKLKQEQFAVSKRRTTLALKSLPLDTTEDDVREAFVPYGDIKALKLVTERSDASKKRAYVEFHLVDHAARAAAAIVSGECMVKEMKPEAYFTGYRVVSTARTPTLRILGLTSEMSVDTIIKFFKQYGKVTHAHRGRGPDEAFVDFASAETAESVMSVHKSSPLKIQNCWLSMAYAAPTGSVRPDLVKTPKVIKAENTLFNLFRRTNPPCPTIFVNRLSRKLLSEDIRNAFGAFGEVQSVRLTYHRDSNVRMNATVEFSKTEEATAAIEAWSKGELAHLGNNIRIDYVAGLKGQDNPPYHTLRIAGFSGGWKTLFRLLQRFRSVIWHSHILGGELTGKGLGVAYVEFDTVESATKVKELLHEKLLEDDGRLNVTYAKVDKDSIHRKPGGVWGQDSGGEKWSYGLVGREEVRLAKIKENDRLEIVKERKTFAELGAMAQYIKPPAPRPKKRQRPRESLVDKLLWRRAEEGSGVKAASE